MNTSIGFPNLNIDFGFVAQSISIRGFEISVYGIFLTVGMLLEIFVMVAISKAQKENPNLCLETMLPALAGGLLGARLLYVGLHWDSFAGRSIKEILDFRNGGLYLFGGILGAVIFGFLFTKIRRISFAKMADIACMGLLSGQIIALWGNFFNREAFGEYTDSLFAMELPEGAVNQSLITELMRSHMTQADGVSFIRVHPLFLYESLWCLFLFGILLFYTWKKKYDGEIFLRYLAGYSLGRAGIECLRPQAVRIPGTEIPVFLPVCILLFVICGISASVRRSLSKKREVYRIRREEDRKKAALDYKDIQNFEDVTHEFMGTAPAVQSKKSEENEVPKDAEADKEPEEVTAGYGSDEEDQPEKAESENTELPQEAERNDQQQGGSAEESENKPEA